MRATITPKERRQEAKKQIVELLQEVATHKSFSRVFNDWLKGSIWFLSRGEIVEGKEVLDMYTQEEGIKLGRALIILSEYLENNMYDDILGEIYMEYISIGEKGQFFTPENVGIFMGKVLLGEANKPVSIIDTASGSGVLLLSACRDIITKPEYQKNVLAMGIDLDETCFMMTTLNMMLNGISSIVIHGNSLSGERFKTYVTNPHLTRNYRTPTILDISNDMMFNGCFNLYTKLGFIKSSKKIEENKKEVDDKEVKDQLQKIDNVVKEEKNKGKRIIQLSLFDN